MAFCPNLSDPQVKEEFDALTKKYGKRAATSIWNARERANNSGKIRAAINQKAAKAWLAERFPGMSLEFYDTAKEVGDGFVHGYVHNAGMHLWSAAESGTEYHEAYHMTFRTMLGEEQRQGLYEEARKQFGEPTADEVANILSQFPEISNEEASNLVLEEKMAEEFREYVLTEEESGKGLLGKIAKWFKNLFYWIKAMISDNLSLKQTYSLIQSNNMGKSLAGRGVFRNPQKFQGNDVAYMHRTEFPEKEFTEIKDTLYTIFMNTKTNKGKDFDVSKEMGTEGYLGNIPNNALKNLYKNLDGSKVEDIKIAEELFAAENTYLANKSPENAAAFKALMKKYSVDVALKNNITARNNYANIYKTWNTTFNPITGNVEKYGWRDILTEKLRDNGIKITGKDITEYELQKDTLGSDEMDSMEHEFEILDGVIEKIYGKSQLESSPAKRLTGKVKELLSTIKSGVINKYGEDTFIDKEIVYRELLEIITGKQRFSDMVTALENAAIYKPHTVVPVLNFIKTLDAPEKAMLFNAFALATTEFILMRANESPTGLKVDIFNPNRKGKAETLADSWRKGLVATEDENSRGIYKEILTKEGEEDPTVTYEAIKPKVVEIQEAFKALEKIMPPRPIGDIPMVAGVTDPLVKAVGDIMWAMGLQVGNNMRIQETYDNIHKIVSNGFYVTDPSGMTRRVKGQSAVKELESKLFQLADGIANFKKVGNSKVAEITGLRNNTNFIQAKKSTALQIAEFFAPVLSVAGEGFVNAYGSQIHPTNQQSHMQEIVNGIKDDRVNMIEEYMKDPFIGAHGNPQFQSILFRMLKNNDDYFRDFNVADLDAFRESDRLDDVTAYEDMNKIDSYVVRINGYINSGRTDTTRIFTSVQADRDKYSTLNSPRLSSIKNKLTFASRAELIKAQIVQDFLRIAEAKRVVLAAEKTGDRTLLVEGVHTDPKTGSTRDKDGNFVGRAFDPKFFQFTALDENGKQIVTDESLKKTPASILDRTSLSTVIDKYVNKELDQAEREDVDRRIDAMVQKIEVYMKNQATKLKAILSEKSINDETHMDRIGIASMPGATKEEAIDAILEGFVFEETIMRNEMVKLFRGSRAYSKDLVDFFKRMGHLTSPGAKYALKSDNIGSVSWMNGELYGMMDTFNEVTLEDLQLDATPEQVERANKAADNLRDGLISSGMSADEAIIIADAYRPGAFKSTDAQAFISLEMHRGLMQGEGKWTKEDEMAYKNYKQTGEFVYVPGFVPKGYKAGDAVPVYPTKTYFEKLQLVGNSMTPISEKNSYSVLLKSYTKDFPKLEDLRQRMESEGVYAGMDPVHVVNFVSGKKLAKRNVYKITGAPEEFKGIILNKNNSRGLRKPQSIPEMKDDPVVTLNRQIKKNMMANVLDRTDYTFNAGIKNIEFNIKGDKLKALYHAAIEEKLARDMKAVEEELKVTDLEAAIKDKNPAAINKAKLDVLKNIRDIIYKEILDGDLHSNYYRALDIEIESNGNPKFKVPLDLPIYNKKFESIIMSVMNNRAFKQSVKGYEAVQVAQLGGHETNDELKFYEIISDRGKQRIAHAEIMIREDLARQFGIQPGQSLDEVPEELRRIIGYRIPNADKGATVALKIKAFLPENYAKSIVVPGQLIKLMGSDFDVDKLFLMFPEVKPDPTSKWGIKKVLPNYKKILSTAGMIQDRDLVSDRQLNNIIFDTMEAVMTNSAHFSETLSPLDDRTLQIEVDNIRKALPEFDTAQDWNDVSTETDALIRNQAGNKLRGIYANIIAGRNVAQHGIITLNDDYAIKLTDEKDNTQKFIEYQANCIKEVADPVTGEIKKYIVSTDKAGGLFLSAALDAGKDPIQLELNDSVITAPIRALFMAYYTEYNTRTCTNFLNQPYIRMLTDVLADRYGGNTGQLHNAKKIVVAAIKSEMEARRAKLGDETPVTVISNVETQPMKISELNNLSKENRDLEQQLVFLDNFVLFHKAGNKLLSLYKRITPDSMDGLNRIGNIQAYNDKADEFDSAKNNETGMGEETIFFGPDPNGNVIDQFVKEESIYGLQRGYENLKNNSLRVAGHFFPMRTSSAFLSMKERIKKGAGQSKLTSAMHQMIDGNLMFMMLTKKGSPFLESLDQKYADTLYKNPKANIGTNLNFFKKKYPKLASTKFISNFEIDNDPVKGYYGVKFDGSFSYSRAEREEFTSTLRTMMFSPYFFLNVNPEDVVFKDNVIQDPKLREEAAKIKMFGTQLAMHSFLSNAFRQGAGSYHDIIPIEFLSVKQKIKNEVEKKSILDFLHDEQGKLADPNYFDAVNLMTYMQLFGPMKAEGRPIVERKSHKGLNSKTVELTNKTNKKFLVFRNSKTNEIGTFINVGKSSKGGYKYVRLDSAFVGKSIYSLPNIEDETMARIGETLESLDEFVNDIKVSGVNDNLLLCGGG